MGKRSDGFSQMAKNLTAKFHLYKKTLQKKPDPKHLHTNPCRHKLTKEERPHQDKDPTK